MRRHPRFPVEAPVEVSCETSSGETVSFTGTCLNLSETGLMMRLPAVIPVLNQIRFRIAEMEFEGSGVVRHCGTTNTYCLVGIEFSDGLRYLAPVDSGEPTTA